MKSQLEIKIDELQQAYDTFVIKKNAQIIQTLFQDDNLLSEDWAKLQNMQQKVQKYVSTATMLNSEYLAAHTKMVEVVNAVVRLDYAIKNKAAEVKENVYRPILETKEMLTRHMQQRMDPEVVKEYARRMRSTIRNAIIIQDDQAKDHAQNLLTICETETRRLYDNTINKYNAQYVQQKKKEPSKKKINSSGSLHRFAHNTFLFSCAMVLGAYLTLDYESKPKKTPSIVQTKIASAKSQAEAALPKKKAVIPTKLTDRLHKKTSLAKQTAHTLPTRLYLAAAKTPFTLYINKSKNLAMLISCKGEQLQVLGTYKTTDAQDDGMKKYVGERRTPEGRYSIISAALTKNPNHEIAGSGYLKLNYPRPDQERMGYSGGGVLICGAGSARVREAINKGRDVMNVSVAMSNKDFLSVYQRLKNKLKDTQIIIEDERRPYSP